MLRRASQPRRPPVQGALSDDGLTRAGAAQGDAAARQPQGQRGLPRVRAADGRRSAAGARPIVEVRFRGTDLGIVLRLAILGSSESRGSPRSTWRSASPGRTSSEPSRTSKVRVAPRQ